MHLNRGLLNWGVFLIALGGIPLAVEQGWLESNIAGDLGQLWPLILVGIGLGLILRWTPLSWFGGALVAATFGLIFGAAAVSIRDNDFANLQGIIPAVASGACTGDEVGTGSTSEGGLADAEAFSVDITLSCGELQLVRAAGATWAVEARHGPDDAPRVQPVPAEGVAEELRISQKSSDDLALLGRQVQSHWDVDVPADAALRVMTTLNAATGVIDAGAGPVARVEGTFNASETTVDLADASTPASASVDLTLNASDGRLSLPSGGITASLTLNASSLMLCVPESAALQVDYSSVLGSDDLDSSGLAETSSGQWSTTDFAAADDRVAVSITNTVSSLSIERPEVCS